MKPQLNHLIVWTTDRPAAAEFAGDVPHVDGSGLAALLSVVASERCRGPRLSSC